jgi:hypothetical protein
LAKTRTRAVLPVPCGRLTEPRTIWSALRGSPPAGRRPPRSRRTWWSRSLWPPGPRGPGSTRGRGRSSRPQPAGTCCASRCLLHEGGVVVIGPAPGPARVGISLRR